MIEGCGFKKGHYTCGLAKGHITEHYDLQCQKTFEATCGETYVVAIMSIKDLQHFYCTLPEGHTGKHIDQSKEYEWYDKNYAWDAYKLKIVGEPKMNVDNFNKVVRNQVDACLEMLIKKADEYATGKDRLHNFNVAATLQGASRKEALAGMMAKHTVSIYDMCRDDSVYCEEVWEEKITDHINYLLLLKAIVMDGNN